MSYKLIGLMPVRNEDWCLGLTARAALRWVDELVILDHASHDRSVAIEMEVAAEHPGRVHLLGDLAPAWNEMQHRQWMLDHARGRGATHMAIIDADEIITGNISQAIRGMVRRTNPGEILQLPLYNLRLAPTTYHANGLWGRRIVSVAFANSPHAQWSGDRFHSREPLRSYTQRQPLSQDAGGVMHLWGMSEQRLRAKHALYKVTERLRWPQKPVAEIDALYSLAINGRPGDRPDNWTYYVTPLEWWRAYDGIIEFLRTDDSVEPWQSGEVRNIVASNPRGTFEGLDLFGIV